MSNFIKILQLIVSIGLAISVLLQSRGTGLSSVFGGDSAVYRSKRGLEKGLFYATIIFAISMVVLTLLNIVYL